MSNFFQALLSCLKRDGEGRSILSAIWVLLIGAIIANVTTTAFASSITVEIKSIRYISPTIDKVIIQAGKAKAGQRVIIAGGKPNTTYEGHLDANGQYIEERLAGKNANQFFQVTIIDPKGNQESFKKITGLGKHHVTSIKQQIASSTSAANGKAFAAALPGLVSFSLADLMSAGSFNFSKTLEFSDGRTINLTPIDITGVIDFISSEDPNYYLATLTDLQFEYTPIDLFGDGRIVSHEMLDTEDLLTTVFDPLSDQLILPAQTIWTSQDGRAVAYSHSYFDITLGDLQNGKIDFQVSDFGNLRSIPEPGILILVTPPLLLLYFGLARARKNYLESPIGDP